MQLYRQPAPTGLDGWILCDEELQKPKHRQVLVRIRAVALNHRDILVATAKHIIPRPNLIPVSDGAGDIVELGPDATKFAVGDRVAGVFAPDWISGPLSETAHLTALGGAAHGVLSEYRLFEEDALVHVPEHLSFEEGSTLPCAAVTAWNALYGLTPIRAGDTILVLGTGGVSVFATQFAYAAGAKIIAVSSDDAKLAIIGGIGASELINYRNEPNWENEARRVAGHAGIDHVVETAGTLAKSLACVRVGGQVSLIGALSENSAIAPAAILKAKAVVRGVFVGSRVQFEDMNRAIALHRLKPVIDRVFPFSEATSALQYLRGGSHVGKVVIRIDTHA